MKRLAVICAAVALPPTFALADAEVLMRCGESSGHAYVFRHELYNPSGASWMEDGVTNGRIILVRDGEEWDVRFNDALRGTGYREDGALVIRLPSNDGFIIVGAFHANYTAIYTFNLLEREVAWTNAKTGVFAPMVALYRADCE